MKAYRVVGIKKSGTSVSMGLVHVDGLRNKITPEVLGQLPCTHDKIKTLLDAFDINRNWHDVTYNYDCLDTKLVGIFAEHAKQTHTYRTDTTMLVDRFAQLYCNGVISFSDKASKTVDAFGQFLADFENQYHILHKKITKKQRIPKKYDGVIATMAACVIGSVSVEQEVQYRKPRPTLSYEPDYRCDTDVVSEFMRNKPY